LASHAFGHRHVGDGNEGHHVDGAQPGMFALVGAQVDGGNRALEQFGHTGREGFGRAGQREDRAVMVGVGLHVEHAQAGDRAQRVGQGGDHFGPAAFADVGNAFNGRHCLPILGHPFMGCQKEGKCYNHQYLPNGRPAYVRPSPV